MNNVWKGEQSQSRLCLKNNAGELIEPSVTADYVNGYFTSIGSRLAENLDHLPGTVNIDDLFEADTSDDPFDLSPCNDFTSEYLAKDIDPKKSSSVKDIRSIVIKDVLVDKPCILTHMINCSIQSSVVPRIWKQGLVTPLPKSGDLSKVTNWRPISAINIIGKLLEKVVHTEIMCVFRRLDYVSKKQFGFMSGRSTMQAVFNLVQDLYEARNKMHDSAVVFLDLRKAFDTVNHGRLLEKLKILGCSKTALLWFRSYLEDRSQRTNANGRLSDVERIVYGVPQGSVLGPLLFVLYINDITACINNAKFYLYADDLAIMV